MSKSFKVLAIVLVVLFCAGTLFAQSAEKKAAWPAYAFTIILGFGSGEYYLGENGTGFLIGDLLGIGTMVGGSIYMVVAPLSAAMNPDPLAAAADAITAFYVGVGIISVGSVVYLVSRVWQAVDTFMTAGRLMQEGKVAAITPVIDVRPQGVAFELSYKY
jgi:hypothetical protein